MKNVIALILGGGRGARLYPLTRMRAKPAVPIAGKYRLIDIPVSNCLHAGINRVFILTQFNSQSLHRHINRAYRFDSFDGGFCEIRAAQQTADDQNWYQGTADAVRQNLDSMQRFSDDTAALILSGDQLYRMDFSRLIAFHERCGADVTIAAKPVTRQEAPDLGILDLEGDWIARFAEKPSSESVLDEFQVDDALLRRMGIEPRGRTHLASMGIYLFNTKALVEMLADPGETDFGKEVIPRAMSEKKVAAFLFDGYWEDVGSIGTFHRANLDLTATAASFRTRRSSVPSSDCAPRLDAIP